MNAKRYEIKIEFEEGNPLEQVLPPGVYLIGRKKECDIRVDHPTISKRHARLTLSGEGDVLLEDLGSSNGVFVNGIRVVKERIGMPARLSLGSVTVSVVLLSQPGAAGLNASSVQQLQEEQKTLISAFVQLLGNGERKVFAIAGMINRHIEWKYALLGLLAAFAVINTLLTLLPLCSRSHDYLRDEAGRRAIFIAKQLADANERAILSRNHLLLSTRLAQQQPGVISAQLIDPDGRILAPAHQISRQIDSHVDLSSLKPDETSVKESGEDELLISAPISAYSQVDGKNKVRALAQIRFSVKDVGLTSEGLWRILVISLTTALFFGVLFYCFLFLLTTQPLKSLESELSDSLKGSWHLLETGAKFKELQSLASRINQLIVRMREERSERGTGREAGESRIYLQHRTLQALVEIAPSPLFVLDHNQLIVSANRSATGLCNIRFENLLGQPIYEFFPDADMQNTLSELITVSRSRLDGSPAIETITTRDGSSFALSVTAYVDGGGGAASYYALAVRPQEY